MLKLAAAVLVFAQLGILDSRQPITFFIEDGKGVSNLVFFRRWYNAAPCKLRPSAIASPTF